MAVGDFTINASSKVSLGNATMISGTAEIGTGAATIAVLPNSYILNFAFQHNREDEDVTALRVHVNSSNFTGTVANGSVHVKTLGGHLDDEWDWTAVYI